MHFSYAQYTPAPTYPPQCVIARCRICVHTVYMYLYPIASVLLVSVVSLAGVFTLSLTETALRKYLFLLVSFAVGALIGDAFIHLVPEAFGKIADPVAVSIVIIAGILLFFVLEKLLHWHHHETAKEELTIHPNGRMILLSDGVHNFIDGLIIGASYLVSVEIGIASTIAIVLHEIPQEIGDFGVLVQSGYTTGRALLLNFLSALTALVGVVLALVIGSATDMLTLWLMPLAAGGFMYIAMADLIPEMHKTKHPLHSVLQFAAVLLGIGAMLVLLSIE